MFVKFEGVLRQREGGMEFSDFGMSDHSLVYVLEDSVSIGSLEFLHVILWAKSTSSLIFGLSFIIQDVAATSWCVLPYMQ